MAGGKNHSLVKNLWWAFQINSDNFTNRTETVGGNNYTEETECYYQTQMYVDEKFWLVAVFGTSIAVISTVENIIIMYVFASRTKFRSSHLFYLLFLALFDIFMAVSYIFLMSINVLMDYLPSYTLYSLWHTYLQPMFAVAHIAMATSTFLIVAASIERFLITTQRAGAQCMQNHRGVVVFLSVFFGTVFRGTIYWELQIVYSPHCTGFAAFSPIHSELASNWWYYTIWMFWTRNFVVTFVPFFLLAYLNSRIVYALRRQQTHFASAMVQLAVGRERTKETKKTIRSATRMLVLVVSMYLVANILNVVVTAWEFVDRDMLFSQSHFKFYTFSADVISLLTILADKKMVDQETITSNLESNTEFTANNCVVKIHPTPTKNNEKNYKRIFSRSTFFQRSKSGKPKWSVPKTFVSQSPERNSLLPQNSLIGNGHLHPAAEIARSTDSVVDDVTISKSLVTFTSQTPTVHKSDMSQTSHEISDINDIQTCARLSSNQYLKMTRNLSNSMQSISVFEISI